MGVKMKRSAVAAKVPTTAQIELGEFAINTYDGRVFIKMNNGSDAVVELLPGHRNLQGIANAATALANLGGAPLASPALTGTPTAPTQTVGNNTTRIATTAFVQAAVAALIDSSPGALNTLNELAAALGDDANFASTMTTALAGKAATSHTHTIANVTGLQTALDAKVASTRITISASSPSGGSNGDLWFKV